MVIPFLIAGLFLLALCSIAWLLDRRLVEEMAHFLEALFTEVPDEFGRRK